MSVNWHWLLHFEPLHFESPHFESLHFESHWGPASGARSPLTPSAIAIEGSGLTQVIPANRPLHAVPWASPHCNEILVWHGRAIPIIDLRVWLRNVPTPTRCLAIVHFYDAGAERYEHGGIRLAELPCKTIKAPGSSTSNSLFPLYSLEQIFASTPIDRDEPEQRARTVGRNLCESSRGRSRRESQRSG